MSRISYTVNVEPDEEMWLVRVPEIARSTVASNLEEVDFMARDLISLLTNQRPEDFDLAISVETDPQSNEHREDV